MNRWILIVDDEKELLEDLEYFFKKKEFKVVTAENGSTAILKSQNQKFDCILMDINMPSMTGDQAILGIKSKGPNGDTPIIALSAHLDLENIRKLKGNVVKGFTKPANLEEILEFIQNTIMRK